MTAILNDLSPVATLAASEANLCAAWSDIGCPLPGELYHGPDMFRFRSGLPSPFWNAVYRPRFSPETADEQIDTPLKYFGEHGQAMFWWLTSSFRPTDLGARLEARGLSRELTLLDMAADLAKIPESSPLPAVCKIVEVVGE